MSHRILSGTVLAAAVILIGARPVEGQTRGEAETRALLSMLAETIDLKYFQNPMTLRELTGLLYEKFAAKGKELAILINEPALTRVGATAEVWDARPIRIPPYPKRASTAIVLRIALGQMEGVEATYLVRQGVVEIVPAKHATPVHLLKSSVQGAFAKTPLEDVLQELAYQTGASVALDPRAGDKARSAITATFRNDATLEAALRMVAEMAELKLVALPGGLFVTTPEHADRLLKERTATPTSSLRQPCDGTR